MKRLILIMLVVILVPQVAMAAWWNPFSWGQSASKASIVIPVSVGVSNATRQVATTTSIKKEVKRPTVQPEASLSNNNYYTNVDGNSVHSPAYSNSVPSGATARCRDGTYSFSQHRSGTCSRHGGVAQWL